MKLKKSKPDSGGRKIAIVGSGMMTGVGLNSPASCAAIRCKISNGVESDFKDNRGEFIIGHYVPLDEPWRGRAKLLRLIVPAIRECLDMLDNPDTRRIPLLLCVAEKERPGRIQGLDDLLMDEIREELSEEFSRDSAVIPHGRVGGAMAIRRAMELIQAGVAPFCIVAGVDSYMTGGTLAAYVAKSRLFTLNNSNGFSPGEAGCAVVLGPENPAARHAVTIEGVGFGKESAHIESEDPLRADGMVQAIREALQASGKDMGDLDYRITDASGEHYVFKEAALALTRILRKRKERFDMWQPAESVGDIGSAFVPCALGVARAAAMKRYALGKNVLCHCGNDAGERGAIIINERENGDE